MSCSFATAMPEFSMSCGSSWEVDLRADVDCNDERLQKCHPRYTLGWQNREVQLYRSSLALPQGQEYVQAYCDVWKHGRIETALAVPRERSNVRRRVAQQARRFTSHQDHVEEQVDAVPRPRWVPRREPGCQCTGYKNAHGFGAYCKAWEASSQVPWCYVSTSCEARGARSGSFGERFIDCVRAQQAEGDGAERTGERQPGGGRRNMLSNGPNVLLLVVRSLSLRGLHASLPRTVRAMAHLERGGRFHGATYARFAAASGSGEAVLQSLVHGTAERPLPAWAAARSIWQLYERWGYVSAFGESSCVSSASRAVGYSLAGESPVDHALVEPACALDGQLMEGAVPREEVGRVPWHTRLRPSNVSDGSAAAAWPRRAASKADGGPGCDYERSRVPSSATTLLGYMRAFFDPEASLSNLAATPSDLAASCAPPTQTLPRHHSDTTQTLPRHYQDTTQALPRHCPDTTQTLPRRYPDNTHTLLRHPVARAPCHAARSYSFSYPRSCSYP